MLTLIITFAKWDFDKRIDERVQQYANQTSYAITNNQVWVPLTDFENFDYAARRSTVQVTETFSFDDSTVIYSFFPQIFIK